MSKRYTPNTNQQGHQIYQNNQIRIKPEVITQLINEMKILIQEMKTIRTVTENKQLSKKNSNTKDSPNQETQTKSNKENLNALSFEVASIASPPQTSLYREAMKKPTPNEQRNGTKLEKKWSRTRTTPTKNRFEALETIETEDETPYLNKTQSKKILSLKQTPPKIKTRENQWNIK